MPASNKATDNLVSAIYVSSATWELSTDELIRLLSQARAKNMQRDITGMLLYGGGNFMQVIEGPAHAIDDLLHELTRDPRHFGMMVLKHQEIDKREFAEWHMAFRDVSGIDLKSLEGYSPLMELSFSNPVLCQNPAFTYRLLTTFKANLR